MKSRHKLVGVSLAMAAGLLAASCGSSASSSEQSAETTDSADSVTTSSTEPPVSPAPGEVDPTALLVDFATAWDAADWDSLGSLATSNVVDVAMEWYDDGGNASDGLSLALENGCLDEFDTGSTCQFVYAMDDSTGLIFDVTYASSDTGLVVTDLMFGGDAG